MPRDAGVEACRWSARSAPCGSRNRLSGTMTWTKPVVSQIEQLQVCASTSSGKRDLEAHRAAVAAAGAPGQVRRSSVADRLGRPARSCRPTAATAPPGWRRRASARLPGARAPAARRDSRRPAPPPARRPRRRRPSGPSPPRTVTRRLVFFTLSTTVSWSSGRRVRRSITSASMPSLASSSAASSAKPTIREWAVDGDVGAGAADLGLADRHQPVLDVGHVELVAVEHLVLEEDHRVGVADRRLEQALGVGGVVGRDHLQARHVGVPAGVVLAVLGGDARGGAVRAAEHDRAAASGRRTCRGSWPPN